MHEENISANDRVQAAIQAVRERPVPAGPPAEVMGAILGLGEPKRTATPRAILKTLGRANWMARLAMAAAVVLAVTLPATWIWRSDSPGGAAFGQVLQHFRSARSARLHLRIEQKGQPAMDSTLLILGEATRQEETNGRITISDTTAGKCLILNPAERKAVLTTLTRSADPNAAEPGGPLDLIERLQNLQEGAEVSLGTQTIDGRTALGFQVNKAGVEWTIWADARSRLPLRTECHLPLFEATAVMTDFEFDVDLDPALFSLVPPEGYTLEERSADLVWSITRDQSGEAQVGVGMDFSTPREEDLLEYLRLSAEHNGGVFSGDFLGDPVRDATAVMKDENAEPQARAEALNLLLKSARATKYLMKLQSEAEQGQISPVGDGVKLGDSTLPVLIWKPIESSHCRAIFGDLGVRDISVADAERLISIAQQQQRQRQCEQGYLGVELTMKANVPRLMGRLNRPDESPVLELARGDDTCIIDRVLPASPAEQAGLEKGDALLSLDGQAIRGKGEFVRAVKQHKPGEKIVLVILRGEQQMTREITLAQRPG